MFFGVLKTKCCSLIKIHFKTQFLPYQIFNVHFDSLKNFEGLDDGLDIVKCMDSVAFPKLEFVVNKCPKFP